ncbi:MAG: IS5 family transposase, partial [Nitrospiraceae bacterium]
RERFPEEHIPDGRPGRRPVPARAVLEAVLWILNTGAHWHRLPQCDPNYKTVHRRFQQWREREVLRDMLTQLANTLREEGEIDERESFIEATFASAKGGGDGSGNTRRGKGVKILAIVDRHGLPRSVSTHAANHHAVTLVHLRCDVYMLEAKPEHLLGARASDSDGLDDALKQDGVAMIAPPRSTRKLKPQDGRRPAAVPTPLARRAMLCMAAMETPLADPLGILRSQLPRFRATRINHHAAETILR